MRRRVRGRASAASPSRLDILLPDPGPLSSVPTCAGWGMSASARAATTRPGEDRPLRLRRQGAQADRGRAIPPRGSRSSSSPSPAPHSGTSKRSWPPRNRRSQGERDGARDLAAEIHVHLEEDPPSTSPSATASSASWKTRRPAGSMPGRAAERSWTFETRSSPLSRHAADVGLLSTGALSTISWAPIRQAGRCESDKTERDRRSPPGAGDELEEAVAGDFGIVRLDAQGYDVQRQMRRGIQSELRQRRTTRPSDSRAWRRSSSSSCGQGREATPRPSAPSVRFGDASSFPTSSSAAGGSDAWRDRRRPGGSCPCPGRDAARPAGTRSSAARRRLGSLSACAASRAATAVGAREFVQRRDLPLSSGRQARLRVRAGRRGRQGAAGLGPAGVAGRPDLSGRQRAAAVRKKPVTWYRAHAAARLPERVEPWRARLELPPAGGVRSAARRSAGPPATPQGCSVSTGGLSRRPSPSSTTWSPDELVHREHRHHTPSSGPRWTGAPRR